MGNHTNPPRPVETVETTFEILEILNDNGLQTLTEISDGVGLALSTTHRHLRTLEHHGFVTKDGSQFRTGLRFLDYGIQTRETREVYNIAKPQVEMLANETGEKVRLTALENGLSVLLYRKMGDHPLQTTAHIGQHRPLHHLAAGKAMLAGLDQTEVDHIIERHGLSGRTENTITATDELYAELEETRERGYGLNFEESIEGLNAVGVAITEDERPIGALSVSGPANRLDRDLLENKLAKTLMGAANEVEINLKYS